MEVRDLAIRGAEVVAADEARRLRLTEELIAWSTDSNSSIDREALRTVRETAWR